MHAAGTADRLITGGHPYDIVVVVSMNKRERPFRLMAQAIGGTVLFVATNAEAVMWVENPRYYALLDRYDLWQLTIAWPVLALEIAIGWGMLLVLMAAARLLVKKRFLPLMGSIAKQYAIGAAKGLVFFVVLVSLEWLLV